MPGSERSIQITDTYRDRLQALTGRMGTHVRATWQTIVVDDLDRSHETWLAAVTVALQQAQRAGVNLTLAYLAAFIASETGHRVVEIPRYDATRAVGPGDDGQPLEVPLGKTLIGVKALMKDGKPAGEALEETGHRAERIAVSAVMAAPRRALADQISTHPMIVGWQRVTRGGCGACLAAASRGYSRHEPLRVHPHCHCSQEPVIRDVPDRAKRATGPEVFAAMSRAEQDHALGRDTAQLVRDGRVAWGDLIATSPMVVGPDAITQAPLAALT